MGKRMLSEIGTIRRNQAEAMEIIEKEFRIKEVNMNRVVELLEESHKMCMELESNIIDDAHCLSKKAEKLLS